MTPYKIVFVSTNVHLKIKNKHNLFFWNNFCKIKMITKYETAFFMTPLLMIIINFGTIVVDVILLTLAYMVKCDPQNKNCNDFSTIMDENPLFIRVMILIFIATDLIQMFLSMRSYLDIITFAFVKEREEDRTKENFIMHIEQSMIISILRGFYEVIFISVRCVLFIMKIPPMVHKTIMVCAFLMLLIKIWKVASLWIHCLHYFIVRVNIDSYCKTDQIQIPNETIEQDLNE